MDALLRHIAALCNSRKRSLAEGDLTQFQLEIGTPEEINLGIGKKSSCRFDVSLSGKQYFLHRINPSWMS